MTRLWDTFIFRDELDMLQCRLQEMDSMPVYRHVIVEAGVTHQRKPKPFTFLEAGSRFDAWRDKIVYVKLDDLPGGPWDCIAAQREAVHAGLHDMQPGDVVMHSDVDEIPSAEAVDRVMTPGDGLRLAQRCAVFAVDWLLPWPWNGPVAVPGEMARMGSFRVIRDAGFPVAECDGGWHLSWIGGNDEIKRKKEAYCHLEMDEYIDRGLGTDQFYKQGIFWGHGQGDTQLIAADVDETWPQYVWKRQCPMSWFRPRKEDADA